MLSLVDPFQSTAPGVRATPLVPARRASRLAELAEQVRRIQDRWQAPAARCPTGLPPLDAALGGGLPAAAVHELIATADGTPALTLAFYLAGQVVHRHGSGSPNTGPGWVETQSKIQNPKSKIGPSATTAAPAPACRWVVYLDPLADLYPPGVAQLGVPLGQLLVVRTTRLADALWVAEQALRCRAVGAVVAPLRTLDAHASRRLQLAAEAGGGVGLLIRRTEPDAPTFAASRLRLEPVAAMEPPSLSGRGRGRGGFDHGGLRMGPPSLSGRGRGRVEHLRNNHFALRITILKQRDGPPSDPFIVELPHAADFVPAHAALCHGPPSPRSALGG
jgi:hypothetical protein